MIARRSPARSERMCRGGNGPRWLALRQSKFSWEGEILGPGQERVLRRIRARCNEANLDLSYLAGTNETDVGVWSASCRRDRGRQRRACDPSSGIEGFLPGMLERINGLVATASSLHRRAKVLASEYRLNARDQPTATLAHGIHFSLCDVQFLGHLPMCYAMTDLKAFLQFAPTVVAKKWRRINLQHPPLLSRGRHSI